VNRRFTILHYEEPHGTYFYSILRNTYRRRADAGGGCFFNHLQTTPAGFLPMMRRLRFAWIYLRRPTWDSGIAPPELHEFIATQPPGRAIDLGCGTGTNVIALAQNGWQVTGVDFIPKAIKTAKRKLALSKIEGTKLAGVNVDLRVGDVTNLHGIAGPFELALDIGCFHGVDDKSAYLKELDRLLVPGGHWLLYVFFKPASHLAGPGLAASDLTLISARGFSLLSRTDGFDKKERPSAWFLFQKTPLVG
jgi:SAM-dependent methyltransferase